MPAEQRSIIVEAEDTARSLAASMPIDRLVRKLCEILGERLTALVVDRDDPAVIKRWSKGLEAPSPQDERRLRDAFVVAQFLMLDGSREMVRSWFIGMNPRLDEEAPVEVLAAGGSGAAFESEQSLDDEISHEVAGRQASVTVIATALDRVMAAAYASVCGDYD